MHIYQPSSRHKQALLTQPIDIYTNAQPAKLKLHARVNPGGIGEVPTPLFSTAIRGIHKKSE